jgi:peptidoglycan hydrolase-like protein with peptidoglycan-binding domain
LSAFFAEWTDTNEATPRPTNVDTSLNRFSVIGGRVLAARRRVVALATVAASATAVAMLLPGNTATADPSAHTWYRLRMCESSNNYSTNTGNGYYGAYQFDLATWRSVGGSGYPNQASPGEQDARALILYRMRGWQPWTCASILGLREDADARSGRINDIHVPGSGSSTPPGSVPSFPGSRWYHYGDWNNDIKQFQNQMHSRGYFPAGTGQYGPLTLTMVKQLQRLNGLIPNGYIGPNTWRLAWIGKYTPPVAARPTPAPKPKPASPPPFPGKRWYHYGDSNNDIKQFQNQMHSRGYFPAGTGQYGPLTLAMVKQLQRLNGLIPNGYIGPNTWRLAWTGKYTAPSSSKPADRRHRHPARSARLPAFPGIRWYRFGDWSNELQVFQNEMHKRGYFPAGTGQYGPLTLAMVKQLQRLNGLIPNGLVGPKTWRLAWVGKYHSPSR